MRHLETQGLSATRRRSSALGSNTPSRANICKTLGNLNASWALDVIQELLLMS